MTFPNPHRPGELVKWNRVKLGGRVIKAILRKVDGNEIEDEWTEQRATGTSGAKYIFKGTKPAAPITMTFEAVNDTDPPEVAFDDLMEIYDMLAPKPGFTGTVAPLPGSQYAIGSPARGSTAGGTSTTTPVAVPATPTGGGGGGTAAAAGGQGASSSASSSATDNDGFPKNTSTTSPGPKPPTLSIESAYFQRFGITAVSRKKWKGPYVNETNSWSVDITFVPQAPVIKAGVGAASAKTPDQFSIGSPAKADPAAQAQKDVANAGAQ